MANYYVQAILAPANGVSRDIQVNTFAAIAVGDLSSTQADDWTDAIKAFYDDCATAGALRDRATIGHVTKFLAADGSVPNYPIFENGFALANTPTGIELPPELALCVSYADTVSSSVPRARRRGRIYISGWSEAANTSGRPTSGVPLALATAYKDYADAVNLITDLTAGVWSRSNATVYAIDQCHVDNEWDTMRSRGGRSDARSTLTI